MSRASRCLVLSQHHKYIHFETIDKQCFRRVGIDAFLSPAPKAHHLSPSFPPLHNYHKHSTHLLLSHATHKECGATRFQAASKFIEIFYPIPKMPKHLMQFFNLQMSISDSLLPLPHTHLSPTLHLTGCCDNC